MSTRKDSKGRILRQGEGQRPNGQYSSSSKTRKARRNTSTRGRSPRRPPSQGQKVGAVPPRNREAGTTRLLTALPSGITVLELVEKYVATKTAVRPTTRAGYKTVMNFLRQGRVRKQENRRHNDARREELADLSSRRAREELTARFTAFEECFAQLSSLRRKTTSSGATRSTLSSPPYSSTTPLRARPCPHRTSAGSSISSREISITRDTTKRSTSSSTRGCISEFCGLTKSDLDFENGSICVNKQLPGAAI